MRLVRSNSAAPIRRSCFRTAWLTRAWETRSRSALRPKCNSSARTRKISMSRSSITPPCVLLRRQPRGCRAAEVYVDHSSACRSAAGSGRAGRRTPAPRARPRGDRVRAARRSAGTLSRRRTAISSRQTTRVPLMPAARMDDQSDRRTRRQPVATLGSLHIVLQAGSARSSHSSLGAGSPRTPCWWSTAPWCLPGTTASLNSQGTTGTPPTAKSSLTRIPAWSLWSVSLCPAIATTAGQGGSPARRPPWARHRPTAQPRSHGTASAAYET